ncbi:putative transcriptional regulator [Corynebacterium mustelae]|uniref:Putative transcriptional regulator n=1 Tax=Corynebacterium mustelae TaxID=571915 RepID=A0A0G3GTV7_9CORY|nr:helix-turn-helix domain-containing protein [Corynebacterium mustelae]AKK04564.1 putative transcriptional regulator [Corynebacterium mustelae]
MNAAQKSQVGKFGRLISDILDTHRRIQKVTQAEIEKATGISQSQVSKQLRGLRPINIDELEKLCSALNLELIEVVAEAERQMNLVDDLAARRKAKSEPPAFHSVENSGWSEEYAADSSPEELFPGDDGYHDGP